MTTQTLLVISPLPTHPQDEGANRRVFAMMEVLRDAGHTVHFAFVPQNNGDQETMRHYWGDYFHLLPYTDPTSVFTRLLQKIRSRLMRPHNYPIDAWYDPQLSPAITQLRDTLKPDAVLVEYVYLSRALELFETSCLKIIDTHDVMTDRHARGIAQGQRPRWFSTSAAQERKALQRADLAIAIQDRERDFLGAMNACPVVTVGHIAPIDPRWHFNAGAATLLYVGTNNASNVQALQHFVAHVLPALCATEPALQLHVAGKVCLTLDDMPLAPELAGHIVKHGVVDDLAALYANAAVVINPVRFGTGLKIKNVEALSQGCPLVTTSVGAEGMEEGAGSAFLVADGDVEFTNAILELLRNRARAEQLSAQGFALIRRMNARSSAVLLEALGNNAGDHDPVDDPAIENTAIENRDIGQVVIDKTPHTAIGAA